MEQSIDEYKIVVAPMLYMFRAGFEERVREFVRKGGKFVLTYWSGVVDESDLCMLGGTPGNLMDVMGIRSTEIDALYDGEFNRLLPANGIEGTVHILNREYSCENLCQLVKTKEATPFMVYGDDFYAQTPAATVNKFGEGKAYYICADVEEAFYEDLYKKIVDDTDIILPFAGKCEIPAEVEVTTRYGENETYIFVQNFGRQPAKLGLNMDEIELLYGEKGEEIKPLKTWIIREKK